MSEDPEREEQTERMREALQRKDEDARLRAQERAQESQLEVPDREQDVLSPRAKNSGHGKKTADKWNQ